MENAIRIWKDVNGHEEHYQISNEGDLKNKITGKIKQPVDLNSSGYPRHTMYYGDKPDRQLAHRLVAEHFIPNEDNKPCVNHINCNKLECCDYNLEWIDYSENKKHAIQNDILVQQHKERMKNHVNIPNKNITPIVAVDLNDQVIGEYDSITQAAKNDTDRVYIQRHIGQYIEKFGAKYLMVPVSINK